MVGRLEKDRQLKLDESQCQSPGDIYITFGHTSFLELFVDIDMSSGLAILCAAELNVW
jgi:hypothetical protein